MISKIPINDAVVCKVDDNIVMVAKTMKDKSARYVYILDSDNKPVGIISPVDICNKFVAAVKEYKNTTARDIMNSPVDCVDVNQQAEFAMKIMMERKSYACPVTKSGKLVGLVDYKDVVEHIARKLND